MTCPIAYGGDRIDRQWARYLITVKNRGKHDKDKVHNLTGDDVKIWRQKVWSIKFHQWL